ncbi:phage major tail protein, TP901-1 family [Lacticaseibacillus nasuensis]|uniref:phage major tail protein, TP901-1 family n=1 Tax=Lacticaseibacillus nasuensis TaxID=944671 RepID=UPI000B308FE7|nr:phage major tail protein, TP901-1 family [Lacticaseibacillus nasuensis]
MPDTPINNGVQMVKDTPVLGKDVMYFIQSTNPEVAPVGAPAIAPAHVTSGDTSIEGDLTDEQTHMGRILGYSANEDSVELTHYLVPGDKAKDIIIDAKHNHRQVKVWRVEVDPRLATPEGDDTKAYPAMFGYAVVESVDISDEDGFSEIDFTLDIIGKLVDKYEDGTPERSHCPTSRSPCCRSCTASNVLAKRPASSPLLATAPPLPLQPRPRRPPRSNSHANRDE